MTNLLRIVLRYIVKIHLLIFSGYNIVYFIYMHKGMTEDEKIIFINKMQDMRTELLQEQSELERQVFVGLYFFKLSYLTSRVSRIYLLVFRKKLVQLTNLRK
jgi:hypothetical protein